VYNSFLARNAYTFCVYGVPSVKRALISWYCQDDRSRDNCLNIDRC
jgi:hypothetical protein